MKTILIAEDNTFLSLLIRTTLEKEGYNLLVADDGKQALELIQENHPDIILTDIMMPYLSGLEIVSKVRTEWNLETPILVLSAAGQEEFVFKTFELGINGYIKKPFNPKDLVNSVKKILN